MRRRRRDRRLLRSFQDVKTVGYARVSTGHQSLQAQTDALTAAECERIFTDKLSGAREDRPGLAHLLDFVGPRDTVVVALDRLGRSHSGVLVAPRVPTQHHRCVDEHDLADAVT